MIELRLTRTNLIINFTKLTHLVATESEKAREQCDAVVLLTFLKKAFLSNSGQTRFVTGEAKLKITVKFDGLKENFAITRYVAAILTVFRLP